MRSIPILCLRALSVLSSNSMPLMSFNRTVLCTAAVRKRHIYHLIRAYNTICTFEYNCLTQSSHRKHSSFSYQTILKTKTAEISTSPLIKCLPKKDFDVLKTLLTESRQQIWKDWDVDNYPLFLGLIDIPAQSWIIQKQKFVNLILQSE